MTQRCVEASKSANKTHRDALKPPPEHKTSSYTELDITTHLPNDFGLEITFREADEYSSSDVHEVDLEGDGSEIRSGRPSGS